MQQKFYGNRLHHLFWHMLINPCIELFFPALCFICESRLEPNRKIVCRNCFQQLPKFDLTDDHPFPDKKFNNSFILYRFSPGIRILIHLLKYKGYFSLAEYFAEAAVQSFPYLRSTHYDYILPVPLHKVRLRERGFNQSSVLANAIGKKLGLPFHEDIIIRQRNTPSQTKLDRRQRLQNVADAFRCPGRVTGARILMIDDVITTGSTINSCCQALRKGGAAYIDVLALANPILPGSGISLNSEEPI
jgi:ComF family protein